MSDEIEVDQLPALLAQGAALIDVREPDEFEPRHIPGAQPLPLSKLLGRLDEVPSKRPVYVICEHGARSLSAADALNEVGIEAVSVAGGTSAWESAGQPLVMPDS